ncbi:MAG: hypothetical protein ACRDTH_00165 [Pseudonocardiaceae bacterium]
MDAPTGNLAALVQPGGQHPGLRVFHNLLDPEQGNIARCDNAIAVSGLAAAGYLARAAGPQRTLKGRGDQLVLRLTSESFPRGYRRIQGELCRARRHGDR